MKIFAGLIVAVAVAAAAAQDEYWVCTSATWYASRQCKGNVSMTYKWTIPGKPDHCEIKEDSPWDGAPSSSKEYWDLEANTITTVDYSSTGTCDENEATLINTEIGKGGKCFSTGIGGFVLEGTKGECEADKYSPEKAKARSRERMEQGRFQAKAAETTMRLLQVEM